MSGVTRPDLGSLTWVKGEIDQALQRAAEAFGQYVDAPDEVSHLRFAQTHLHQAVGALAMVELDGLARFAESLELLLAELQKGNVAVSLTTLDLVHNALAVIRQYLEDLAAEAPDQPLRLWPIYQKLQAQRGVQGANPGDLFYPDLNLPAPDFPPAVRIPAADRSEHLRAARGRFERGFLAWLRASGRRGAGLADMAAALAVPEALADTPGVRAFWCAALGVVDALGTGRVRADLALRRLWGRIGMQLRRFAMGTPSVAERLLRDALYYVAVAPAATDRLRAIRCAYRLDELVPEQLAEPGVTPLRVALRSLYEPVRGAKEAWNRFCAGAAVGLPQFAESAHALAERARGIGQPELERLCAGLAETAQWLRKDPLRHDDSVAMEVATAVLLVENASNSDEQIDPELAQQAELMARRLACLRRGEPLAPLEQPLLGEMSRRAQEKLLMSQVVRETLNSLAVIEQTLDGYFRDPARASELAALGRPIREVDGALAMLGQEDARALLRDCAARIGGLSAGEQQVQPGLFEDLAHKLSALGLFVDRLQHGPADLEDILHPGRARPAPAEPARDRTVEQELERNKGETQALVEALGAAPGDERLREQIRSNLETIRENASLLDNAELERQAKQALAELAGAPEAQAAERIREAAQEIVPAPAMPSGEPAEAPATQEEIDAELLGIFIEEAGEVLASIAMSLERSRAQPHDQEVLATIRRGFHTLKGSGRMVGLKGLGAAAWAVEQVMNRWLQLEQDAGDALHRLIEQAHGVFAAWVSQLAAGGSPDRDAGELVRDCEALLARMEPVEAVPAAPAAPIRAEPIAQAGEAQPAAEHAGVEPAPPEVHIGTAVLSRKIYDMYVGEARSHVGTLRRELARLHLNPAVLPAGQTVRAAHTLAGVSATVGLPAVHDLARALEHAMAHLAQAGAPASAEQSQLLNDAAAALEAMIAAVAEAREPAAAADLVVALQRLAPQEGAGEAQPAEVAAELPAVLPEAGAGAGAGAAAPPGAAAAPVRLPQGAVDRRQLRLADDVDSTLLPVFLEEADDLMRDINVQLRAWRAAGTDSAAGNALKRLLHTFKGSARMAGAMGLGELLHAIETRVADTIAAGTQTAERMEDLDNSLDRCALLVDRLRGVPESVLVPEPVQDLEAMPRAPALPVAAPEAEGAHLLRMRADLVDRFVNDAGEIGIARLRIDGELRNLRASLRDLTDNVIRLRGQLRELEIQTESQMQARFEEAEARREQFDPLEMDRYTRVQELTRMIAESVNDVATVQQNLLRNLDGAESALNSQGRLNRDLQQALMSVRMVPFGSIGDRLHRIVRQTAKELGKRTSLDMRGGQLELDRGVLERMVGPFEHLLRNAVSHGIEDASRRKAAGKPEIGTIEIAVSQAGNELMIDVGDDGVGLDYERIRARAIEAGLLPEGAVAGRDALSQMIFLPGFSTAVQVSSVSGRGVGMDVVRDAVQCLGGRIEVTSEPGSGTRFRIHLPMTLAVLQAVLARVGERTIAIPSSMVEQVLELKTDALDRVRAQGAVEWLGHTYPFRYFARLLGDYDTPAPDRRYHWLLLARAGEQRAAVEVDSLRGNQEIVIKKTAPQLSRIIGITGATVLGDGEIVLIANPVALYERAATGAAAREPGRSPRAARDARTAVMVVDDSVTVRKITGRLLEREGYRVLVAKDGVDALQQMVEEVPDVMIADIEMPRMDGFDLARNMRSTSRLAAVPIIFVSSRSADKHRALAREIGVEHFLGKPYREEDLLGLVARCTRAAEPV